MACMGIMVGMRAMIAMAPHIRRGRVGFMGTMGLMGCMLCKRVDTQHAAEQHNQGSNRQQFNVLISSSGGS